MSLIRFLIPFVNQKVMIGEIYLFCYISIFSFINQKVMMGKIYS